MPGRIIALGSNRYFGEANNIAAEQARGEYLFFLNNDAFVHEGWLQPLLDIFDRLPNAGAAGSRLVFPDGTLQEAGALITWDGITNQLGKFTPPDGERYSSVRQVDYVSAAAMLIRRDEFLGLLGFDMCWEPAYFEDVDLCLSLRTIGKGVYYCPNSVVTHVENASSLDEEQQRPAQPDDRDQPDGFHRTVGRLPARPRAPARPGPCRACSQAGRRPQAHRPFYGVFPLTRGCGAHFAQHRSDICLRCGRLAGQPGAVQHVPPAADRPNDCASIRRSSPSCRSMPRARGQHSTWYSRWAMALCPP